MKLKICSRYKEKNDPVSEFCKRCGSALELKTALDVEEERRNYDYFIRDFLVVLANRDPKIKKVFKKLTKARKMEYLFSGRK